MGSNLVDGGSRQKQMIRPYIRRVRSAAGFSGAEFLGKELIYADAGFRYQMNDLEISKAAQKYLLKKNRVSDVTIQEFTLDKGSGEPNHSTKFIMKGPLPQM